MKRPPSRVALCLALAALAAMGGAIAQAEVTQQGDLRVSATAKMSPRALPRTGAAPIAVSVAGQISTTDQSLPPQLKVLRIEINRHGRLDYEGLPVCALHRIQPANDSRALSACRSALIGQGSFSGYIVLKGQAPYPTSGRLLVFNGKEGRRQVLLGHIYIARPFASSFVITFQISNQRHGQYGTTLTADLAKALGAKRNLTGIEMTLSRRYSYKGKPRSYVSAGCPAPKGFPGTSYPLARTSFSFAGGSQLSSTLTRSCRVRG
jgi:hypothetical protein